MTRLGSVSRCEIIRPVVRASEKSVKIRPGERAETYSASLSKFLRSKEHDREFLRRHQLSRKFPQRLSSVRYLVSYVQVDRLIGA